ncbi:MAG: nucleotidyltransferase substrate binding protein [Candidatus Muirbacterium halophilum]|nr:nucleotidyltransferase substrate binding protein [Candidatus Muirbacterium halophilum]MCK9476746.1 nucleotidyltransferase substrate binding protein [Candidatus Muirbacterium halophilum]
MTKDIRWKQRLKNFRKAFDNLSEAVNTAKDRELSNLEKQGLIQAFEFTYELAWNTVKDFYENIGESNIQGSKDAFRLAFERGLVVDGVNLMKSVRSRQLSSHTYNEKIAQEIYEDVVNLYHKVFQDLVLRLEDEAVNRKL